jgi:uncharacterized membrane protein YciS (DUF1049 family)
MFLILVISLVLLILIVTIKCDLLTFTATDFFNFSGTFTISAPLATFFAKSFYPGKWRFISFVWKKMRFKLDMWDVLDMQDMQDKFHMEDS